MALITLSAFSRPESASISRSTDGVICQERPNIFYPATLLGRRVATFIKLFPIIICFILVLALNHKRNRFRELKIRPAVKPHKLTLPQSDTVSITPLTELERERKFTPDLQNGDANAFRKLYRMYSANLLGIIYKVVNQRESAEDILQETFIKISVNLNRYDHEKARLFTWMLNIARNSAIDHIRKTSTKNSHRTDAMDEVLPMLETRLSEVLHTDAIGLKKITLSLPKRQKDLIDLVYFLGYTHAEAAEEMQMPLGSVKTLIRRAVLNLRDTFDIGVQGRKSA